MSLYSEQELPGVKAFVYRKFPSGGQTGSSVNT
jgi:hypothetical protein